MGNAIGRRARVFSWGIYLFLGSLAMGLIPAASAQNGLTTPDELLNGFHYGDHSNHEGWIQKDYPLNVWPFIDDYLKYMPDEVEKSSYADFWRWWYILERYKGDDKGLQEMDAIVDELVDRGIKIKIDLCWATWWTLDEDWEKGARLPTGALNVDDWVHLCELLGRRYRGRLAMWDQQGEANDLKVYWKGATREHVHEVYKKGYITLKKADPGTMVGVSGASPSVSREELDIWYKSNIENVAGYYDNIPMNYFADVADPYKGSWNYYTSVRGMLDAIGKQDVEVGMGETSMQWAETTLGAEKDALTMHQQSVQVNEVFGRLADAGMNKFISWFTEFAPGGGHWPWRWGFRNYEDWWGIWPESYKVPGTQIVYFYDSKTSGTVDLRSNWARPADPFYPAWEIYKFWGQLCPAGSESMRIPVSIEGGPEKVWKAGGFQRAKNKAVVVFWSETDGAGKLKVDVSKAGWAEGTKLKLTMTSKEIDFITGISSNPYSMESQINLTGNTVEINPLQRMEGFNTVIIEPAADAPNAELLGRVVAETTEAGEPVEAHVVLKNTGGAAWTAGSVKLVSLPRTGEGDASAGGEFELPSDVAPGASVAVAVKLPGGPAAGRYYAPLRLRGADGGWIGPEFGVVWRSIESDSVRKFIAHREVGQVKLQWFAPTSDKAVKAYEIHRADGFGLEPKLLVTTVGYDYVDSPPIKDQAYYYHVVPVFKDGTRGRASMQDNAPALSKPRIMDAQIVGHTLPATVRVGDVTTATVTVKNTGSKTWDLSRPEELRYWFGTTQLWDIQNENQLPKLAFGDKKEVKTGEEVTVSFPYVGRKPGSFENQWVMRMEVPREEEGGRWRGWDVPAKYAYFGTPLLWVTHVTDK